MLGYIFLVGGSLLYFLAVSEDHDKKFKEQKKELDEKEKKLDKQESNQTLRNVRSSLYESERVKNLKQEVELYKNIVREYIEKIRD